MARLAVATTVAPRATASWTATRPTPPAAPWISTVSPLPRPIASSVCTAVTPAASSPPACSQDRATGFGTTDGAGTTMSAGRNPRRGVGDHFVTHRDRTRGADRVGTDRCHHARRLDTEPDRQSPALEPKAPLYDL
ncbi:hypothetical protein STENM327S_00590 [Streptomyces tendae]